MLFNNQEKNVWKLQLTPFQYQYMQSSSRFPSLVAGIGTGKTMVLLMKIWRFCEKFPRSRALIVRNEFTDLRDSTMKDFQDYFGVTVGVDKEYELPNKSVIMFRHGSELNTLKNITLDIAGIEQAEEFLDETQFMFIRDRLRGRAGSYQQLCIIANACGHNWIWKFWVNRKEEEYELITANSFDNAENLPEEFVKDLRRMQKDEPHHFARYVMNSFEELETDDFVFNFMELLEAKNRQFADRPGYGHRIMGFDIARFGNDKCAAVGIQQVGALAWKVFHKEQWEHRDLSYTTGRILFISGERKSDDNIIDEDGLGGGPLDFIQNGRKRMDFRGFRNHGIPYSSNCFFGNPRTEAAFKLREYINKGHFAGLDDELIEELMTLRFKYMSDQRRILVSKEELRKIGVKSPNLADALIMASSLIEDRKRLDDVKYYQNPGSYKEEDLFKLAGVR